LPHWGWHWPQSPGGARPACRGRGASKSLRWARDARGARRPRASPSPAQPPQRAPQRARAAAAAAAAAGVASAPPLQPLRRALGGACVGGAWAQERVLEQGELRRTAAPAAGPGQRRPSLAGPCPQPPPLRRPLELRRPDHSPLKIYVWRAREGGGQEGGGRAGLTEAWRRRGALKAPWGALRARSARQRWPLVLPSPVPAHRHRPAHTRTCSKSCSSPPALRWRPVNSGLYW
jgi:hypothetical protein